jgi:hypothetical protein
LPLEVIHRPAPAPDVRQNVTEPAIIVRLRENPGKAEQMLEFSTKVDESDATEVEKDLLELMKNKQVEPAESPESKTQTVLDCLLKQSRP